MCPGRPLGLCLAAGGLVQGVLLGRLAHTSSERSSNVFQVVGLDPGSSAQTERLCQNKCGNMDAVMTPPGSGPMFGNRPEAPTSHLR